MRGRECLRDCARKCYEHKKGETELLLLSSSSPCRCQHCRPPDEFERYSARVAGRPQVLASTAISLSQVVQPADRERYGRRQRSARLIGADKWYLQSRDLLITRSSVFFVACCLRWRVAPACRWQLNIPMHPLSDHLPIPPLLSSTGEGYLHQTTHWRTSGRVRHLTIVLTAPHNLIPPLLTRTSIPSRLEGRRWMRNTSGKHSIGLASGL